MAKDPYVQVDLPFNDHHSAFEDLPISKLVLSDKNPRKITSEQMQKLQNSLSNDPDFLVARPVCVNLVDGQFFVYAGNQRVRAAKKLGWKKIKCYVSHDLKQDVIDQRMIKDNKTFGEFDYDILANNYEIDLLLDSGFVLDDLHGFIEEPMKDKKKDKKEKTIKCPNCLHEFTDG